MYLLSSRVKIVCSFYLFYGLNLDLCWNLQVHFQVRILFLLSPVLHTLDSHTWATLFLWASPSPPVSVWVERVPKEPAPTFQIDTLVSCPTVSPVINFLFYFTYCFTLFFLRQRILILGNLLDKMNHILLRMDLQVCWTPEKSEDNERNWSELCSFPS